MKNSKLIELLAALTKRERDDFKALMASGLLKYNREVFAFLNYLIDQSLYNTDAAIDRELVHKAIFPKKKYSEQRLYDHFSYAQKATEEFLVYLNGKANDAVKRNSLLEQLRKRGCDRNFEITSKATHRHLEKQALRDESYHYNNYLLEAHQDDFITKQARTTDDRLQAQANHLDAFFLAAKLKNLCEMINRQNILKTSYDISFAKEITEHIEANEERYAAMPAVRVYFQIYRTLTDAEDSSHHDLLVELLEDHRHKFSAEEAKGFYQYAQNYCIKRLNSGDSEYLQKLFDLYKMQIENGVILQGKYINQFDYKNIVTVGLRLQLNDYIEQFINDFKIKLPPSVRENAYNYNLASFYYETHAFKLALQVLQEVEFTDVYYQLSARSLLLKLYYEQDDIEALLALITSFKMFLRRQKLMSDYQRTVHLNLLDFTKKMARLRERKPQRLSKAFERDVDALLSSITEKGNITNVNWLKAQVQELKEFSA